MKLVSDGQQEPGIGFQEEDAKSGFLLSSWQNIVKGAEESELFLATFLTLRNSTSVLQGRNHTSVGDSIPSCLTSLCPNVAIG